MINRVNNNFSLLQSFKGYSPDRKFDLTKINDIPCAYCGQRMLSLSEFDKRLNEARTFSKVLQLGRLYSGYMTPDEISKLNPTYLFNYKGGYKKAVRALIMPHVSTIEHIIPQSKKGIDDISNYMAACYKCNSARRSIDIIDLLDSKPEIAQNIQNHIKFLENIIPKLIKERRISPKYENYPKILAKSLNATSSCKLDILG